MKTTFLVFFAGLISAVVATAGGQSQCQRECASKKNWGAGNTSRQDCMESCIGPGAASEQ